MAIFDLSKPVHTTRSFDFKAKDLTPASFCVVGNGNYSFMVGNSNKTIYRFDLAEPFTISSAAEAVGQVLDVSGVITNVAEEIQSLRVSENGLYIFVTHGRTDLTQGYPFLSQWQLASAYDLTSASFISTTQISAGKVYRPATNGIDISEDGSHLIMAFRGYDSFLSGRMRDGIGYIPMTSFAPDQFRFYGSEVVSVSTIDIANDAPDPRGARYVNSGNQVWVCGDFGIRSYNFDDSPYRYSIYQEHNLGMSKRAWERTEISALPEMTSVYDLWVSTAGSFCVLLGQDGVAYEYSLTQGGTHFNIFNMVYAGNYGNVLKIAYEAGGGVDFRRILSIDLHPNGVNLVCGISLTSSTHPVHVITFELQTQNDLSTAQYTGDIQTLNNGVSSVVWAPDGNGIYVSFGFNLNRVSYVPLPTQYRVSGASLTAGTTIISSTAHRFIGHGGSDGTEALTIRTDDLIRAYDLTGAPFHIETLDINTERSFDLEYDPNDKRYPQSFFQAQQQPHIRRGAAVYLYGTLRQFQYTSYFNDMYQVHHQDLELSDLTLFDHRNDQNKFISGHYINSDATQLWLACQDGTLLRFSLPNLNNPSLGVVSLLEGYSFDLGLFLKDATFTFNFLNESPQDNTLLGISGEAVQDTIITNLTPTQTIIPGGLEHQFVMTIPSSVTNSTDLTYTFQFDNSPDVVLSFDFIKPILWGFQPDWSQSVNQSYEWSTMIVESLNKSEQRAKLRSYPRALVNQSSVVYNDVKHYLLNKANYGVSSLFALPRWEYMEKLSSAVAQGGTVIFVDTTRGQFSVGGMVTVFDGSFCYEILEIQSIGVDNLSLVSGVEGNYSEACYAVPCDSTYLTGQIENRVVTKTVSSISASFELANKHWWHSDVNPVTTVHQSSHLSEPLPVYDMQHYIESLPSSVHSYKSHRFSTPTSVSPTVKEVQISPDSVYQTSMRFYGKQQIDKALQWMSYLAGSYNQFWVIPEGGDFSLAQDIPANSTAGNVVIKDQGFYELFTTNKHGNIDIVIETKQQLGFPRFVYLSVSQYSYDLSSKSVIMSTTSAAHLTEVLSISNVKRISVLRLVRANTDKISVAWAGPNLMTVTTELKNLRY